MEQPRIRVVCVFGSVRMLDDTFCDSVRYGTTESPASGHQGSVVMFVLNHANYPDVVDHSSTQDD